MADERIALWGRFDQLRAENSGLREFHDVLRAQRKELMDQLFGSSEKHVVTDEEIAAVLKDPNRVSFRKMMADLGITSSQVTESVPPPSPASRSRGLEEPGSLPNPAELRLQIEQLEAENKRLREVNDYLRGQRKKFSDVLYADLDAANALTEEEMAAAMRDPNRMSFSQLLAELGIK